MWDVFRREPCLGGRGRRAAADFVVLGGADFFVFFFSIFFFSERTRPAASMRPACLIYLSTSNEARPLLLRNEAVFAFRRKSLFIPGCVQGAII